MGSLNKFNRVFKLLVETGDNEHVVIESPLTCEFDIVRANEAKTNSATFRIFNLSETIRKKIFKDRFDLPNGAWRSVQFWAGYKNADGEVMPRIFNGDLWAAFSSREGTEYITTLECFDAGSDMVNTTVNQTFPPGTTRGKIIQDLVNLFPHVDKAFIGSLVGTNASKRGVVLMGNVFEILSELTNNKCYIDSRRFYVMGDDEVVKGASLLINTDTGLLGTPRRLGSMLEMDMIFEPRVDNVGMLAIVDSRTDKTFNGQYKVTGFHHRGVISDSVPGDCSTTISILYGAAFKAVQ